MPRATAKRRASIPRTCKESRRQTAPDHYRYDVASYLEDKKLTHNRWLNGEFDSDSGDETHDENETDYQEPERRTTARRVASSSRLRRKSAREKK
jgi:hypothetical protein